MRLYSFEVDGQARLGAALPDHAHGQERLLDLHGADPGLPGDLLTFIRAGRPALARAQELLLSRGSSGPVYPLRVVRITAPLARPGKILSSGINYRSHQAENPGATLPDEP
ncbi:MAG: 5-carboxymethyl-2-hydroxymuconate isomerase, partial [Verrucomicrobia bacterium]|nr:5-carboxymethyl-2-hydroxymuconate isomerase [Verrucomicrobiota bacterium]